MNHFLRRSVLSGVCVVTLLVLLVASPFAGAQQSAATGRTLTDFVRPLVLDGFDPAAGELAAVDITLSADMDSRVLEITNSSAGAADFTVMNSVRFCGDLGPAPASFQACVSSTSATALIFQTEILSESFVNLAAGATAASAQPTTASDLASTRVVDPALLAQFVGVPSVDFGVATLAGFEALGGGGNSLVEIETYANVRAQIDYLFAGVAVDKLTNGGDGVAVLEGQAGRWTYDVANTGNTTLQGCDRDRRPRGCHLDLRGDE